MRRIPITLHRVNFSRNLLIIFGFLSMGLGAPDGVADELGPYVPKSRAPMDVTKGASAPVGAVTAADINEFRGEFGGILYMGKRSFSYEEWPGKSMSDCKRMSA